MTLVFVLVNSLDISFPLTWSSSIMQLGWKDVTKYLQLLWLKVFSSIEEMFCAQIVLFFTNSNWLANCFAVVDDCSDSERHWLACNLLCKSMALCVSFAYSTYCLTDDNIRLDDCLMSALQDSSFLYMGRLLEGFGVGIISYVVSIIKLHPWLFSA